MPKITVYTLNGRQYMGFERVSYGKKDTPEKDREYRPEGLTGPVGARKEIKDFLLKNKYLKFVGVVLTDKVLGGAKSHEFVLMKDL